MVQGMTNPDLLDFLRHFAETRDWRTWNAIPDAYADAGEEMGERIASEIKASERWPKMRYNSIVAEDNQHLEYVFDGYYWEGISWIIGQWNTYHDVPSAYVALINAVRKYCEQPQEV